MAQIFWCSQGCGGLVGTLCSVAEHGPMPWALLSALGASTRHQFLAPACSPGSCNLFLWAWSLSIHSWVCACLWMSLSAYLSAPCYVPCVPGVSNCVSLPVCPVQLDSVEEGAVWILCFFCPPRPCPHPRSEAATPCLEFSLQHCSADSQGVTFPSSHSCQSHLRVCQSTWHHRALG